MSLWTGEAPSEHSPRSVTTPRCTFPTQMRGERHPRSGRRCPGSSSHFPPPGRHEHPINPTDPTWCHADALSPLGSTHPAVGLSPRSPGVRPSRSRFSATRLRPPGGADTALTQPDACGLPHRLRSPLRLPPHAASVNFCLRSDWGLRSCTRRQTDKNPE